MKKFISLIGIVFFVALLNVGCTKEEVKPQGGGNSNGGTTIVEGF